jgi:hypothetical protein
VGTGEVAAAHEKLPDNLTTSEGERLLEERYPGGFFLRVMRVQPGLEAPVRSLKL